MSPDDVAVEEIAQQVARLVGARAAGHCIRIPDLPPELADLACGRASQLIHPPDVVCLVTTVPTRPWHKEPTKVVELRNASERDQSPGRLVIFVPAGQRVAAEDSFGRTTFEVASFTDVYADVVDRLKSELERKDPEVARLATEVVEAVRRDGNELGDRYAADYLAAVGAAPTAAAVGAQLPLLGLIPDAGLGGLNESQRGRRLFMNARQMSVLSDLSPPPERVRKIPLDTNDREHREILRSLLGSIADGTVDRFEIARRLGHDDVKDSVDFARWRLELVSVVIDELSVTGLIGDFDMSTEPIVTKANASIGVKYRCRPAPANIAGLEELCQGTPGLPCGRTTDLPADGQVMSVRADS